jgi:hypothetical protein
MYFLRRSLSTLIEFRGGLTTVRLTREYKQASLTPMDGGYTNPAEQFLQEHWDRHPVRDTALLRRRREVTWQRPTDDDPGGLSCAFAGHVVAGAISSKLAGRNGRARGIAGGPQDHQHGVAARAGSDDGPRARVPLGPVRDIRMPPSHEPSFRLERGTIGDS